MVIAVIAVYERLFIKKLTVSAIAWGPEYGYIRICIINEWCKSVAQKFIVWCLFFSVCYSTEIRNSIAGLKRLENCTVIEGYLRIILIASDDATVFRTVSLPKLRVITDYLLLYRVQYLKTLSNIFPNLSAIRGRRIFYHYALVVYEMFSLEDLGLHSLMSIERGAVLVAKNPQLCYLDTIDWKKIMRADAERSFWKNKEVNDCILIYPQTIADCPMKEVLLSFTGQLVKMPLCWNSNTCQRG